MNFSRLRPNQEIMFPEDTTGILITPVAKVIKSKKSGSPDSRRDYDEQCVRFMRGQPMCWDDDKHNNTKVGDVFGFHFQDRHDTDYSR